MLCFLRILFIHTEKVWKHEKKCIYERFLKDESNYPDLLCLSVSLLLFLTLS